MVVNFLGHTFVAQPDRNDPAYLLGTMIPDFAGMVGARLDDFRDSAGPHLSVGIDVHLATDTVFHTSSQFVAMSSALSAELAKAGVLRGTSMAVGHVGIELLFDRELLKTHDTTAYLAALRHAPLALLSLTPPIMAKWSLLSRRLLSLGLTGYDDLGVIRERLTRALSSYKRLAIRDEDQTAVRDGLDRFVNQVADETPTWFDAIRAGLVEHPRYIKAMAATRP